MINYTPIGIKVDIEQVLQNMYIVKQDREEIEICQGTDFNIGHIKIDDVIFLPEGTNVIYIDIEKNINIIGKVIYYNMISHKGISNYDVAIVKLDYDKDQYIKDGYIEHNMMIKGINKGIISSKSTQYVQVINIDSIELDFVRIEYEYGVKMFYMYGYLGLDNQLYVDNSLQSEKININREYSNLFIYNEIYDANKVTNIEHTIELNNLVPNEMNLIFIYIILMCISIIFKQMFFAWFILTCFFIKIRKFLRKKYID